MSIYSLHLSTSFLHRWSLSKSTSNASPDQNVHSHPRKSAHCSQKVALNISTNILKSPIHLLQSNRHVKQHYHPHLRAVGLEKACATVSLSNTTASATSDLLPSPDDLPDYTPANFIPFPSSPIQFLPKRSDTPGLECGLDDLDFESRPSVDEGGQEQRIVGSPTPWHVDLRRKKAKSCLASSYLHCDAQQPSTPPGLDSTDQNTPAPSIPLGKRSRLSSIRAPKLSKRARKTRKQAADLEFLAMMHRSLAHHLRSLLIENGGDEDMEPYTSRLYASVDLEQDVMLVERIWCGLVERGYKPVLSHEAHSSGLADIPPHSDYNPESRIDQHDVFIVSPTAASNVSNKAGDSEFMTVSQLVASLILRINDRRATRPRSSRLKSVPTRGPQQRMPSPLHQVVTGSNDLDEVDI